MRETSISSEETIRPTPIAIVGMSCLFPKAQSLGGYWSNIKRGVDAVSDVPPSHWNADDYYDADPKKPDHTYCRRGGFLSPVDFDPTEFGISPHTLEATDSSQILSLIVAQGALADAGYGADRQFNRERVGVILGVTGTLQLSIALGGRLGHPIWRRALEDHGIKGKPADEIVKSIGDQYVVWQEGSFPGLLGNVVAGRIANRLDLGGTNCVVDAACASSISAAHLATLELASGRSDMVVTGGADTFNDVFMFMCFSKTPALSPTGDIRPFDADADGTMLGEGIGMVVLKRLKDAERDGDKIYAVIKGIGTSSDGRGKAIYAPSAEGQVRALEQAYRLSGVSPATVELVEAHGTGTKAGDAAEVSALKKVYRSARESGVWCALGSVKSQIGHTKAAAGVAGLIKIALALHHKILPPTIKVSKPAPALVDKETPFYVSTEKRPWLARKGHPRRAAVSAFGFGGSNFHAVLEEFRSEKSGADWDGRVQIAALSAESLDDLKTEIARWSAMDSWDSACRMAAASRREFSSLHPYRLVVVLEKDKADFKKLFGGALDRLVREKEKVSWSLPEGAYFGRSRKPGKLAFLFPGQGSQYVGMARDLICLFPKMQEALTQADLAYGDVADLACQLSDFILPHATFSEEAKKLNELALRATHVAQPAIGAISMGMVCLLTMFGAHPAMAAGHSFGELMALFTGGRIDAKTLLHLAKVRGELMAKASDNKGSMIAVQASLEEAVRVIEEERLGLTVANLNAPRQIVLSGPTPKVERAAEIFRKRKLTCATLPVGAAFHSALVASAQAPFREALREAEISPGKIPVYSNTTNETYPDDADQARDLLGTQLANPVNFRSEIERMYEDGARTFVEVGPGAKLTGLVKAILGEREYHAIAADASSGRGDGIADFARALAQLAALGHPVDLRLWEPESSQSDAQPKKHSRMTVSICGAQYRAASPKKISSAEKNGNGAPAIVESREEIQTTMSPQPAKIEFSPQEAPKRHTPAPPPKTFPAAPASPSVSTSPLPSFSDSTANPILLEALRTAQENLVAVQRLQEQTTQIHRRFLEGQESSLRALQELMTRQQGLYEQALGMKPAINTNGAGVPSAIAPGTNPSIHAQDARDSMLEVVKPTAEERYGTTSDSIPSTDFATLLLEIVGEKTGYPVETLNLSMDLESDLGIDSIKRVEILSAVQEKLPDAPAIQPDQMGKLRTLDQIIAFLSQNSTSHRNPVSIRQAEGLVHGSRGQRPRLGKLDHDERPERASQKLDQTHDLMKFQMLLLEVVSEKTGYPMETLNLDMDMESDLGIDSIKRVEILSVLQERIPDAPTVKPEEMGKLRTLGQIIAHLNSASGSESSGEKIVPSQNWHHKPSVANKIFEFPAGGIERRGLKAVPFDATSPRKTLALPSGSEIWIADDGAELGDQLAKLLESRGLKTRIVNLEQIESLATPIALAGLIILASEQRLAESGAWDVKSEEFLKNAFRLTKLAGPALRKGGSGTGAIFVTVSRMDGSFGLNSIPADADPIQGGLAGLTKTVRWEWPEVFCKALDAGRDWENADSLVEVIADEMFKTDALEVGLSPTGHVVLAEVALPESERNGTTNGHFRWSSKDVIVISGGARGVTAETAVALAEDFQPTLVLIGRSSEPKEEPEWLQALYNEGEIKRAIASRNGGATITPKTLETEYRRIVANREISETIRRIEAVGSMVVYRSANIRDAEAVRKILDETRRQLGPIRGLIHGAGVLQDRLIGDKTDEQFSEVFDTKIKGLTSLLAATRDDDLKALILFSSISGRYGRKGQADYAMANEALNKIARQQAALRPSCRVVSFNWGPWDGGMVNAGLKKVFESEGIPLIPLREGARCVADELHSHSPSPVEILVAGMTETRTLPDSTGNGVNGHSNGRNGHGRDQKMRVAFERVVDLEGHPFLQSHVINGQPVLPVAVIIEWLAHGALHENPGLVFHGFNDLRVCKGVILENGGARKVAVMIGEIGRQNGFHAVEVELRGTEDTNDVSFPILHARAEILLAERLPESDTDDIPVSRLESSPHDARKIYEDVLFHGEHFQGIRAVEGCSREAISASLVSAPRPSDWIREPLRSSWLADPLALDASFQLMVLWGHQREGVVSLPCHVAAYRQFRGQFPKDGVRAVVKAEKNGSNIAKAEIVYLDADGNVVARMRGYECVMDPSLNEAFRRNRLASAAVS